jgi:hypothetical protein
LLVLAQRPDATELRGFRAWQRQDRIVLRGSKAVWVWAPIAGSTNSDGWTRLKLVPLFDIAQTALIDGEERFAITPRGRRALECLLTRDTEEKFR